MQALRGIAGSDDAAMASWQAELAAVLGWWRLDPLGVSHLRAAGTARAAGVERAKVALAQQDVLRRLEAAGEKRAALRNQLQDLTAKIAVLESDAEKLARVADTALAAEPTQISAAPAGLLPRLRSARPPSPRRWLLVGCRPGHWTLQQRWNWMPMGCRAGHWTLQQRWVLVVCSQPQSHQGQ